YDMGHVLDFVPNHMGIAQADNPWWLDVLEWGPASPAAEWFDIDWRPAKRELHGKVLLPFLGDHYGRVITRGVLRPAFDPGAGTLSIWSPEPRFPLAPRTYPAVLGEPPTGIPRVTRHALERVLARFAALPAVPPHDAPRTGLVARGARCQRALARLARAPAAGRWLGGPLARHPRRARRPRGRGGPAGRRARAGRGRGADRRARSRRGSCPS